MWKWIVNNDNYREAYHDAFNTLITDYCESGNLKNDIDQLYKMLLPYVEKDPTAFYSAEEYTKACEVLKEFCKRRTESVSKQLDGELSSESDRQNDQDKVDASDLKIKDMGAAV